MDTTDSRIGTYEHKAMVARNLSAVIVNLQERMLTHDDTKLYYPERQIFDEYAPLLSETEYGSDEYRALLEKIRPATEHHYRCNSHHTEYYPDGIRGMDLLDIIEMLCDWEAASYRTKNGNVYTSIELGCAHGKYGSELRDILKNTATSLGF